MKATGPIGDVVVDQDVQLCHQMLKHEVVLNLDYIPGDGTTDAVLDLGNKIFGEWGLEFWLLIPNDKEGYMNLQGTVPIGAGEWAVGNIFFNQDLLTPGMGQIDDTALGAVDFTYPTGTMV